MTSKEDKLKRLNELAEEFKTLYMGLFEDIAKDFERLEKKEEILKAIKDLLNDGVLWLEMEHEIVESEQHKKKKQLIKEWLNNDK